MAITGLHNVSSFHSSFFGESQPPLSSQWGEQRDMQSPRASSLLQIWRELEGEHGAYHSHKPREQRSDSLDSDRSSTVTLDGQGNDKRDDTSEAGSETENQGRIGSDNEQEDNNSTITEQSTDLGEVERERVRQIFRGWMKGGAKCHPPNAQHRNISRPQWLGENECERVRTIREWVQMNTQQRSSCRSHIDGDGEVGFQIEQMHNELAANHSNLGARRPIRRLCGRQTLLDLLLRAQSERKRELLKLSECKPVSKFAHRNRIQAVVRGSFLRKQRLILDKRSSSVAASELGLLRQRHTVSDLRDGFLSKFENSPQTEVNSSQFDVPYNDESNGQRDERSQSLGESKVTGEDMNRQESDVQVAEVEEPVLDSEENVREVSSNNGHIRENDVTRTWEENNANEQSFQADHIDGSACREVLLDHDEPRSRASDVNELIGNTYDMEQNMNEEYVTGHLEFDWQDASVQEDELQESVIEFEERDWRQVTNGAFSDWMNGSGEDVGGRWEESTANQWFPGTSNNEIVEPDQIGELHEDWQGQDLQEAIDSWLDMPSGEESSIPRIGSFNFLEDENIYSMELRELFTRRRVSSLLRSGFRESLDQVLQSHVERQGRASSNWELENTSPNLTNTDQEQQNGDQNAAHLGGAEGNPLISSSSLVYASLPFWDDEFLGASRALNSHQCFGIDCEVINELRIDMAGLQQKMTNMQSMLESCMDMQIELQRSVQQELSAALNRSVVSTGTCWGNNMPKDESRWDHVRKGICCICSDSKIHSLLYRCGHMCTCSKCADNLVQDKGNCPMCDAPVVEAVQAYFVQ
ncbi:Zinc finger, RING FYVE PHD-type [Olea europaea subsp. europaea]|uniref:Zinc finger, RING FYVE PHD-type n=1 Tax=Olea europaea subsp. europaea TaxID=158383 RepID=A0A8S0PSJ8_OLEEU|nr:Zinc finger, RING FYVE PHD-type [Olea europaea subsp. europaea]